MKRFLSIAILMLCASASYANSYTCYRYVDGHPTGGWITMQADSKSEAEAKAYARFKELGGQVDSVNCH
jgi:hypothetical protein